MPATITTLQAAVKTALEAIAEGDRPVAYSVRVQEADVANAKLPEADADVVIGFESSKRLDRTAATILEQYLIPITVRRRNPTNLQSITDENHWLVEKLRDTAAEFHTDDFRVDDILSPNALDMPEQISGQYCNRFVLDFDVIRRVAEITQDTSTEETLLTKIRTAVWNAIDHSTDWDESTWVRKFRDDVDLDELALHDPASFEMPAIAVVWGPTAPKHWTNSAENWPATVQVVAWFPVHQMRIAELRAREIVRAINQSKPPGGGLPYVREATRRVPEDGQLSLEAVELGRSGQLKALKLTVGFTLTGIVAPRSD